MTPSVSCWIPNSNGIMAKGSPAVLSVLLRVATPTAESELPVMKLAEAEKHIGHDPFLVHTTVHPTFNGAASETIAGPCGRRRNSGASLRRCRVSASKRSSFPSAVADQFRLPRIGNHKWQLLFMTGTNRNFRSQSWFRGTSSGQTLETSSHPTPDCSC